MSETFFDCFNYTRQEFLVCVTIHKARNLCAFNADTYVKVTFNKKHKSTKLFQNSENPYFNDYFVFELFCSLSELLRLTILFQVYKRSCCRRDTNLGEIFLDLTTVWNQPGHAFFKKWGKLESPLGEASNKSRGHLQIDLSIVSRNEPPAAAVFDAQDHDDIEKNLLQADYDECDVNNVRHYITIYKGMFMKRTDYIVQVSFAGFHGKTKVAKACTHPEWNEQFSFNWVYPSLCRTFLIQVMANELLQWKCVSNHEIHFDDITFPGSFPSFGPSFLHLYDSMQTNNYVGRIMIVIKTEKLQKHLSPARCITSRGVPPLAESSFWAIENFAIVGLIWEGDFIRFSGNNIKFNMRCGEWCSNVVESPLYGKDPDYRYFSQENPQKSMHLSGFFPDYRLKYEVDQFLKDLHMIMKTQLYNYKLFEIKYSESESIHAKCLRAIVLSFMEKIQNEKGQTQYNGFKELTDWDKHRNQYISKYLDDILTSFEHYRKILKSSRKNYLANVKLVCSSLALIMKEIEGMVVQRLQNIWPDLILEATCNGGAIIANCRLNATDYIFSTRSNCSGRFAGKRHSLVLKPIACQHTCKHCGCVMGKIDCWIWIGTEKEYKDYCNPLGWILKQPLYYGISEEKVFACKIYIHQGKIRPGNEKITGECWSHARLTFLNHVKDTKYTCQSLSPIWNQVITFHNNVVPGQNSLYAENPLLVAIEMFCLDAKWRSDYLGCGMLRLSIRPENDAEQMEMLYNRSDSVQKAGEIVKKRVALSQLNALAKMFPPPLKWLPIARQGAITAEILVSGELIETGHVEVPEPVEIISELPAEICPINTRYKIEVIFAGFRNFQKLFQRISMGKYRMKLQFADLSLISGPSSQRTGESINFLDLYATGLVNLPEQQEYWPPIILTQITKTKDNHDYAIGAAMLMNPQKYLMSSLADCFNNRTVSFVDDEDTENQNRQNPKLHPTEMETSFFSDSFAESTPLLVNLRKQKKQSETSKGFFENLFLLFSAKFNKEKSKENKEKSKEKDIDADMDYTWWTKFYNSTELVDDTGPIDNQKHHLVIYGSELENQMEFDFLQDWAEPIPLIRGMQQKRNGPPKEETYCNIKCHIEIRKCRAYSGKQKEDVKFLKNAKNMRFQEICSLINEVEVVVRVYVVQGLRIRSMDRYSMSDAYVKLQFGNNTISDRANYIPNQANPIFGRMFQMDGVIPREHILHISVYDYDMIDDLIGCTNIDLEDRLRSKHRAAFGIPSEYSTGGYNVWRNLKTPLDILKEIALKHELDPPEIIDDKIHFAGRIFSDSTVLSTDEALEHRLSLSVLKRLDELPEIGYKLVPEHVETRSLYRTNRPGIEQGKLQLWVEIYEKDNVPPPIEIAPVPPKNYELRVIILNTAEVILDEANIFGKKMSDIYLKGWLEDINQAQYTDVHYRSFNGAGNFNWRMIFRLRYSSVDDTMVLMQKAAIYEQYDTELKVPPIFYIQIWDNDVFSPDDFLGVVNINLSHFQEPSSTAKRCSLKTQNKYINLFAVGSVKGWFPATGKLDDGSVGLTGKVEMQMQILSEAEANSRPVGLGRSPPEPLPAPKRPETSFSWISNPFLSLRHILWPQLKKLCCYLLIIIFIISIIFIYFSSLPGKFISNTIPI